MVGVREGRAFVRACPVSASVVSALDVVSVGARTQVRGVCVAAGRRPGEAQPRIDLGETVVSPRLTRACSDGVRAIVGRALEGPGERSTRLYITGVRCAGARDAASLTLADDEDFAIDCGAQARLAGVHGYESTEGRVLGLGVVCRTVVTRGARQASVTWRVIPGT